MITRRHGHRVSYALIFFLLFSLNSLAQLPEYTISGKVTDEAGIPLEYATISLKDTENPDNVTGGITDAQGNFEIEVPEGVYDITVEFISFEPKTFAQREINSDLDLGTVVLGMAAGELSEVVVTAETTQVEVRLDKKIYTIGKDLTTAGGTVADALNNVPSVAVDVEGAISLRGNENVRILINGKPSAMAGFGNTDVLSQLPADAIERVEVITSPSARYDAEGTAGILNIILKKEKTLGFNGSLTVEGGYPEQLGISANVNYRTDDFNIFNTTGYRYFDAPGNSFSNTYYFAREDGEGNIIDPYRIIEDRETQRLNSGYYTSLGMEYYINDQSSVTATGFFRWGDDEDLTTNSSSRFDTGDPEERGRLVRRTVRTELQTEEDQGYQLALNYINRFNDEGHQLTADLQYENDAEVQRSFVQEDLVFNELPEVPDYFDEEAVTTESQNEYLIKADYVLPFEEDSQFEAGFEGNFEKELTEYRLEQEDLLTGDFVLNDTLSNDFVYHENVISLYSQYGTKLGDFSFLLGLRLENTQLKGEIDSELSEKELQEEYGIPIDTNFDNNYLGLFPTLNLIYEIQEDENITLGYNRRINRPRGWFINPFPSRQSRTDIFQGNPNLEPAFSNAFDLGYLKRWDEMTFTSSVYYQHETDAFQRIEEPTGYYTEEDNILITRTIPVNLATNTRIGAEAGLLYNPTDWLRLNGSMNFFQFDTEGSYDGEDYSAKSTSWFARFSSKVTLPEEIQWQTNAFYRGASEDIQGTQEALLSVDVALAKDFWNESATISFNVRDLFNTRKRESFTRTDFYQRESRFQWRQRSFNLSLTYRFNQQKREQQRRGDDNGADDIDGGEF